MLNPDRRPMNNNDPHDINVRLARQVSILLEQLEQGDHVTIKDRFQALMAIARIQYVFVGLRKEKLDEPAAGTSVRRYQAAFTKNDPRGRKKAARTTVAAARAEPEPDSEWLNNDGEDGDAA